jgi:putative transposase
MSQPPKPRRSGPPHNPGVRDLIAGKRQWTSPQAQQQTEAKQGFRGWHERGYLPHRDEPRLIQFVSFHLADSYPTALRAEWEALLQVEDDLERHRQLEAYLDKGRGVCHLRNPEISALVDEAFRFYHCQHYDLRAWVVMPNHVHALFRVGETPLGKIVKQFKEYTAREANKLLKRRGQFWAEDCWDTFMRDAEHELKTRRYIESNPVKAGLIQIAKDWPWSSARFRDENGVLHL